MVRVMRAERDLMLLPILATALALLVASASPAAEDLRVEAEEFPAYGSNDLGGIPILIEFCGSASEYYTADGIDVPGEWIKLKVTFTREADYRTELAYQATYGDVVTARATILDYPAPGETLSTDFTLADGYGFG
jgi:hypothetical protein